MNWKEQTCEKCKYRVDNVCRRFPPSVFTVITGIESGVEEAAYPQVAYTDGFHDACAEYVEENMQRESAGGIVMVDVTKLTPPKGGSGTAPPKPKEPAVYVEPWKPWAGYYSSDYTAWYEWMRSNKSFSPDNMKAGDAFRIYQIMNDIVYEIKQKNEEVQL